MFTIKQLSLISQLALFSQSGGENSHKFAHAHFGKFTTDDQLWTCFELLTHYILSYLTLILLRLFQQYRYNVTGQSQESEGSYNTIIPSLLSAERDNSRQLAGGNARARNSDGIIFYNTFRFRLEGV